MHLLTPRRKFLQTVALASAALHLPSRKSVAAIAQPIHAPQLTGKDFEAQFDLTTGRLSIWRNGGKPLLLNATAAIVTPNGARHSSDGEFAREVQTTKFDDALGAGERLIAFCRDTKREFDLEIRISLYANRPALHIEMLCKNVSKQPLIVQSLKPILANLDDGAGFVWPGAETVLTNGEMYYDAGKVQKLTANAETKSWWNVCLSSGDEKEGLVIGYLENKSSRGKIHARQGTTGIEPHAFGLAADSTFENEFTLQPGISVSSDRVLLNIAANPFLALEEYAKGVGALHKVHLNPPINGWCSWFSFFGAISEDEVIRNAAFAAKHLKPFGFEFVQVDDGFYRGFGDWEGNGRFPHGMKWLAQKIRTLGLKPGIWLAPYVIAEGTEVFLKHQDWLVRHADGSLKQIGPGLVEGSQEARQQNPKLYSLDITHPDAANWLKQLFHQVAYEWGYDFIKIDFVEWSILAAERYFDPSWTKAAVYRRGVEIMREAIGPKKHLLDCGPGNVSVGLIDSMRIELDQPPVTWQQYFLHSASSAPAAAKRYYFHNHTWINDDDHVYLANLTPRQAQAAASVVSLSGGNMIAGDRLADLDTARLEILRKVFPSSGEAARPIDLFERDRPEIFAQRFKRKFGEWLVVGLFNADEQHPIEKHVTMQRLGLDPAKSYVAFDFWNQRFFGELREKFSVHLEPASGLVLAIHEKRGVPQWISTDRHLSQGALELSEMEWNNENKILRGISTGAPGTDHNVFIYLPEKHPWQQTDPFLFYDFPNYTLKITEENILRVHVRFDATNQVAWELNVKQFFKNQG